MVLIRYLSAQITWLLSLFQESMCNIFCFVTITSSLSLSLCYDAFYSESATLLFHPNYSSVDELLYIVKDTKATMIITESGCMLSVAKQVTDLYENEVILY